MKRDVVFVVVLATVIVVVIAGYAVSLREDVNTVTVDEIELHPESGLGPEGSSFTSDTGNYISPYMHVRMSGDIIEIEFTTAIDPADGYVIEYMTFTTTTPDDMFVHGGSQYDDGHDEPTLFYGDAVFTESSRDLDRSVDTVTFHGSYASDPPTITGPVVTLGMMEEVPGPITCDYSFRFVDSGLLEDRVEVITGSFTIFLDEYKGLLPWE